VASGVGGGGGSWGVCVCGELGPRSTQPPHPSLHFPQVPPCLWACGHPLGPIRRGITPVWQFGCPPLPRPRLGPPPQCHQDPGGWSGYNVGGSGYCVYNIHTYITHAQITPGWVGERGWVTGDTGDT